MSGSVLDENEHHRASMTLSFTDLPATRCFYIQFCFDIYSKSVHLHLSIARVDIVTYVLSRVGTLYTTSDMMFCIYRFSSVVYGLGAAAGDDGDGEPLGGT
mgnify:CR=1 FL=1